MRIYFNPQENKNRLLCFLLFSLGLSILLASYLLTPISWRGLKFLGHQILSLCIFRNLTNLPCPFCGLSRSFVNVSHLNLKDAFLAHFLGIPLFLLLFVATIYSLYCSIGSKRQLAIELRRSETTALVVLATGLIVIAWVAKIYFHLY